MPHPDYHRFNPVKILYYADKIHQIVNGGMPIPVIWHIYPTNFCTHNCSFCIMAEDKAKYQTRLHRDVLLKAVREAAVVGIRTLHFSGGGEPLLHPYIGEAIKLAKDCGLAVALSTNGSLLTPEIAEMVDYPRISLNAGTKGTHEMVMRAGTWDQIMENIHQVVDRRKLGLGYVVTPENWKEVYEFCELASELGVGFVHIRPAYLDDPDANVRLQEVIPAVFGLSEQAKKDFPGVGIHSVKDKFDGYWTPRTYDKCRATPLIACLKANGRFIPCQDRLDLEFGDYTKQSFMGIWSSQEHKDTIEKINLEACPRCVENKKNEYIQHLFLEDDILKDIP